MGGVALFSSLYGKGKPSEKDDPRAWSLSSKFIEKFQELTRPYGGINCRDIARVNWKDKEAAREYYKNPESRRQECIKLLGNAAYELGKLLEEDTSR